MTKTRLPLDHDCAKCGCSRKLRIRHAEQRLANEVASVVIEWKAVWRDSAAIVVPFGNKLDGLADAYARVHAAYVDETP